MPSPTDFNVSPYYDDFSNAKNFHRIFLDQHLLYKQES